MTTPCQRSWEVEAARDGRLTGSAHERLEAHLVTCTSCAREAHALEELARDLRDVAATDDVAIRRLRNGVLEAFDAERTGRPSSRAARGGGRVTRFAMAVAVVVMVVGIALFAPWRAAPAKRPLVPAEETTVEVTPTDGARFSRALKDDVDRFELGEGTLRLRVRHATQGHHVVVKMPDGEIEDIGTVFDVAVVEGHTERVTVEEGHVILRLANAPAVTIGAGEAWRRPAAPPSLPIASSTAVASAPPRLRANASAVATPSTAAKVPTAASAEDKAYLEVLRLLREGQEPEARVAAEAYLRAFPAGFRRQEMRAVAGAR